MANDAWTARTYAATLATATRHGETWTTHDLEFVEAFAGDVSDTELAHALHRTIFAIQSVKHAIRAGKVSASEHRARVGRVRAAASYRGWTCDMGDD
jgi:hypothetical protein